MRSLAGDLRKHYKDAGDAKQSAEINRSLRQLGEAAEQFFGSLGMLETARTYYKLHGPIASSPYATRKAIAVPCGSTKSRSTGTMNGYAPSARKRLIQP